jgi:hypothetical protein
MLNVRSAEFLASTRIGPYKGGHEAAACSLCGLFCDVGENVLNVTMTKTLSTVQVSAIVVNTIEVESGVIATAGLSQNVEISHSPFQKCIFRNLARPKRMR